MLTLFHASSSSRGIADEIYSDYNLDDHTTTRMFGHRMPHDSSIENDAPDPENQPENDPLRVSCNIRDEQARRKQVR